MIEDLAERVGRVFERVKHETLALLAAAPTSSGGELLPEWMTDVELAHYWRLLKDGEPVTAGIRSWVKRPPDEHPLPHAYMGDLLRFRREDADKWAHEEAERHRMKAGRKKLRAAS